MGSETLEENGDGEGQASAPRKLPPGPGRPAKQVAAHQLARILEATTGIVAEQGYGALKVREVVGYAEVSTRAFYEHFSSKEDCFLQTYELISRRATRRIIAAQAAEPDWRERARLILEAFARELEREPKAARLALIEAYAAGEASLAQTQRAERTFQSMLAESFARGPDGVAVPPLVIEAMVAGVTSVSRGHLLCGRVESFLAASEELVEWALAHVDPVAVELADLDRQSLWRDTTLEPLPPSSLDAEEPWPATGDRALILKALADLVAQHGYAKLTAARVRSAASVSRRKFDAYFDSLDDCYLAALEQHAAEALAQASRAQAAARSWAGGVYRAIAALSEHIANDAFLARVLLTDDFPPGPDGARFRRRLIEATVELLGDSAPTAARPHPVVLEASQGALWSLTQHHLIRERRAQRKISASLSYLALVPYLAGPDAVEAIRGEQSRSPSSASTI